MATTMTRTTFSHTGCVSTASTDDSYGAIISAPMIGYWAITTNHAEFAGYVGEGTVVGLGQFAGELFIDHPQQFHGLISLIPPSEAAPLGTYINLADLAAADGANLSGNVLNITAGDEVIDQLRVNVASWGGGMTVAKVDGAIDVLSGHYTGVSDAGEVLLHA